MPKLPDKYGLGSIPGGGGRAPNLISGWPSGGGEVEAALAKGIGKIGATLEAKQEEADDYEIQKRIVQFDLEQEKRLDDAKREAAPEAKDFTNSYRRGYDVAATDLMTRVPDRLKPKVDAALVKRGAAFEKRAYDFELAERDRWNVQDVNRNTSDLVTHTMGSPDSMEDNAQRGVAIIRASRLSNRAKIDAERKFLDMNVEFGVKALIDREIEAGRDAGDVIQRLRRVPKGSLTPKEGPRQSAGPYSVEPQSDGMSMLSTPGGAKFRVKGDYADRFSGLIADLEAAGVEIKGDQSGGYANRNIRGSNRPSEHSFGRAIDINWTENAVGSRGAIVEKLGGEDRVREIAARHGLKWGGDFKGRRRDPMHFEVDPSAKPQEAGESPSVAQRSFTQFAGLTPKGQMTDATPGAVAAEDQNKAPKVDVDEDGRATLRKDIGDTKSDIPGAPQPGTPVAASDELEEADAAEWSYMSPTTRRKLINYARTAGRAVVTKGVDDDIARIRLGREPVVGPDGKTSLDRARAHMTNFQWTTKKREWDEARLEHQELSGLRGMTNEEAADHVATMIDRAEGNEESVRAAARIQKKADARLKKILDMRDRDPVRSVNGFDGDEPDDRSPPLRNTREAMKRISEARQPDIVTGPDGVPVRSGQPKAAMTPQQQWETLFEARLADQREVMPYETEKHRILSRREAEQLLRMPKDGKGLDYRAYRQRLEEAAKMAEQRFGPKYAKRALEEAIGFHLSGGSADQKARQASILRKMAKGEPVTSGDIRALRDIESVDNVSLSAGIDTMARIDRAGRSQGMPAIPATGDAGRPFIGQGMPQPSARQVEWLKANPDGWQVFDQRFGSGASARALAGTGADPWGDRRQAIPKRDWRENEKNMQPSSGWGFFGR